MEPWNDAHHVSPLSTRLDKRSVKIIDIDNVTVEIIDIDTVGRCNTGLCIFFRQYRVTCAKND